MAAAAADEEGHQDNREPSKHTRLKWRGGLFTTTDNRGVRACVSFGVSSVIKNSHQPLPLSFKNNIRTAALGNAALGRNLINQPLIQYLLDHLLRKSFSFISQSLVRGFRGEEVIEH